MCWKWCFAFFLRRGGSLDTGRSMSSYISYRKRKLYSKRSEKRIECEPFYISKPWGFRWCQSDIKFDLALVVSSVVPWLLHDWIAWQLADGTLASTSRHIILKEASELTPWKYLWAKNEIWNVLFGLEEFDKNIFARLVCLKFQMGKNFECLKMTKAMWVFDFLWLCSLLVRDNVSAEHGWAKITEVLNQVTRLVVDSNGCGDSSITILAHKVPGSWVSHWPNSSISPSSHLFWSWFQQSWLTRCQSLGSVTGPATGSTLRILWAKIVGIQIIVKD